MSVRVVRLVCGHERWAPFDYFGGPLPCRECDRTGSTLREVVAITPPEDVLVAMREQRALSVESDPGAPGA